MNNLSHPAVDRPGAASTVPGPSGPRAAGRVLVVDDDDAVRLVISRALARLGYKADMAADGPEAISTFSADPGQYSLVLLDFKLPGMDSGTVYRELRGRRPDLPIVLMSGYNKEEALSNSAGMELAGFLHKPFTIDTLKWALGCAAVA